MRGIDNSYFDTCNYIMKEGRAFTDEDFKKYKKVAILDNGFRKCLFQGRRFGRKYDRDPERALYGNWNRDKGEGVRAGHQFH